MPFFEKAKDTDASHGTFNDVQGNQHVTAGDRHFAGDNHEYRAPVHRGDSFGVVNGGTVGGYGNSNNFAPTPQPHQTKSPRTMLATTSSTADEDDDDDELYRTKKELLETQRELKRSKQYANKLAAELAERKKQLADTQAQLARFR